MPRHKPLPPHGQLVRGHVEVRHLHRHQPVQLRVMAQVHRAHAPRAEELQNAVTADLLRQPFVKLRRDRSGLVACVDGSPDGT